MLFIIEPYSLKKSTTSNIRLCRIFFIIYMKRMIYCKLFIIYSKSYLNLIYAITIIYWSIRSWLQYIIFSNISSITTIRISYKELSSAIHVSLDTVAILGSDTVRYNFNVSIVPLGSSGLAYDIVIILLLLVIGVPSGISVI